MTRENCLLTSFYQNASDIIRELPTFKAFRYPHPLVIILLTPAFTGLLGEKSDFLARALAKLFPEVLEDIKIDVVAAIVDNIPGDIDQAFGFGDGCHEGLSMLVCESSNEVAPLLWKQGNSGTKLISERVGEERERLLSFELQQGRWRGTIKLPLANTLFQNGSFSTLSVSRWVPHIDRFKVERVLSRDIGPLRISQCLKHQPRGTGVRGPFGHMPRLALTPIRQIRSGLGNVISELADDEKGAAEPASRQLEAILSKKYATLDSLRGTGPAPVWAAVYPKDLFDPTDHDDRRGDRSTGFQNFYQGYRLHRVLSGGGGWGQRQGLISLDPEIDFDERSSTTTVHEEGAEFTSDQAQMGEVVRPGDWIQFWTSRARAASTTSLGTRKHTESAGAAADTFQRTALRGRIVFGTSIDAVEQTDMQTGRKDEGMPKIHQIHRTFGGLSRKGIGYSSEVNPPTISWKREWKKEGGTKIDIPGARTRFDFTSGTSKVPATS